MLALSDGDWKIAKTKYRRATAYRFAFGEANKPGRGNSRKGSAGQSNEAQTHNKIGRGVSGNGEI